MEQKTLNDFEFDQDPAEYWADLGEDDWAEQRQGDADAQKVLGSPAVYAIVSRVCQQGTWFDYQDVQERGLGVLSAYDVSTAGLTEKEEQALLRTLLSIGGKVQTREMARLTEAQDAAELGAGEEGRWSLRGEELFRKAFLADLRQRQRGEPGKGTGNVERLIREPVGRGRMAT